MGGYDPYSASKGAAELAVASYRRWFFDPARIAEHGVKLASARAGNVMGGGEWASDRIVPDMVTCLVAKQALHVRNPGSVRPWQHVLEPLSGYLQLAARMLTSDGDFCSGWNFGPEEDGTTTVGDLVDQFCRAWGGGDWVFSGKLNQPHEAKLLQLSIEKAKRELGWRPAWSLREAVEHTVRWYREYHEAGSGSMFAACVRDIEDYSRSAHAASHFSMHPTTVAA